LQAGGHRFDPDSLHQPLVGVRARDWLSGLFDRRSVWSPSSMVVVEEIRFSRECVCSSVSRAFLADILPLNGCLAVLCRRAVCWIGFVLCYGESGSGTSLGVVCGRHHSSDRVGEEILWSKIASAFVQRRWKSRLDTWFCVLSES
jgi:hypothetical protein